MSNLQWVKASALIKKQKEYISFLSNHITKVSRIAGIHGFTVDPDDIVKGKIWREEINNLEKELGTESPSSIEGEEKKVHPVFKGWDSRKLIGRIHERYQELIHKNLDEVGFNHGWLEGRGEMLREMREEWDESPSPDPIKQEKKLPECVCPNETESSPECTYPNCKRINESTGTSSIKEKEDLMTGCGRVFTEVAGMYEKIGQGQGEVPEEILEWIKQNAKEFCRLDDTKPDIIITHKEYSLAGLLSWHDGAKAMYLKCRQAGHALDKELVYYSEQNDALQKDASEVYKKYIALTKENTVLRRKIKELQDWHDSHLT